jgi:hypothetical protein
MNDPIKMMKRQTNDYKKHLQIVYLTKDLHCQYKELFKFNSERSKNPIGKKDKRDRWTLIKDV